MDYTSIAAIVGGVLIPLITLAYIVLRNIKKDYMLNMKDRIREVDKIKQKYDQQLIKLNSRMEGMDKTITKHDEAFKRTRMKTDGLEKKQDKLESSLESSIDKVSDKIDRLTEIIHSFTLSNK